MAAYMCIASNDVPPAVSKRVPLNVNCKSQHFRLNSFIAITILSSSFSHLMMRIIEINRERLVHHHSRSGARFHKTLPNSRPRSTDHHYLQSLLHIQFSESGASISFSFLNY
uniref:Uncharacterized protein n=1 Tax=Daphnia galeata TaxID=27404 RepID=A0A8J2WE13_9CRUS|nr:unnamed protein product [Daphnia galeata]